MTDPMRLLPKEDPRREITRPALILIPKGALHIGKDKSIRAATRRALPLETVGGKAIRNAGLPAARLKRVIEFIDANLDKNITLAELAANAKLSVFYFATVFKKSMGLSPHRYILRRRVFRAAELLRNTSLSVLDVSLDLGFQHQNNFARAFRRIMGMPPTLFRQEKCLENNLGARNKDEKASC